MKRLFTLSAILLTACLIMPQLAWTQAPEKMSYQAVIRDNSGQLITDHDVGIKISILQGSITGTPVYEEAHTATTNGNGLATIEIGGGSIISGIFADIDWTNGPYFLKTQTDPAGGTDYTIAGTSQLLSVPYALHAKTVDLADNSITSAHIQNGSVYAVDMADEPGVNWGDSVKAILIPETSGELSLITINAPTRGYVIVTVSGFVNWHVTSSGVGMIHLAVSATSGNTDAPVQTIGINGITSAEYYRYPFSITRAFPVSAGLNTFYLNGYHQLVIGAAWVHNHTFVALFVPTKY
ncbi:MAG: hypothetical protein JW723_00010 [Bacteroidales bacterium]|nr:hypothetical protein [Bacteroidales bacterium]